jgi:hypothetical protein
MRGEGSGVMRIYYSKPYNVNGLEFIRKMCFGASVHDEWQLRISDATQEHSPRDTVRVRLDTQDEASAFNLYVEKTGYVDTPKGMAV